MDSINISFVTDDNYFQHALVAIHSILINSDGQSNIDFFILDMGISKENKYLLKNNYSANKNIEFSFIDINDRSLFDYKLKNHVSAAAYSKIYICDLLNVDKVIYLDCDLVVNQDIRMLWNEFEEEIVLKAVWNPFYDYDNYYIGIKNNQKTFNSGVMLLNLELMRKRNSTRKLKIFLDQYHDKTILHDQAAFNAVFKRDWKPLNLKWNYQVSLIQNHYKNLSISKKEYIDLYNNPSIIHFSSNSKPWQFRNVHPYKYIYKSLFRDIYGINVKYDITIKLLLKRLLEALRYQYYSVINFI